MPRTGGVSGVIPPSLPVPWAHPGQPLPFSLVLLALRGPSCHFPPARAPLSAWTGGELATHRLTSLVNFHSSQLRLGSAVVLGRLLSPARGGLTVLLVPQWEHL